MESICTNWLSGILIWDYTASVDQVGRIDISAILSLRPWAQNVSLFIESFFDAFHRCFLFVLMGPSTCIFRFMHISLFECYFKHYFVFENLHFSCSLVLGLFFCYSSLGFSTQTMPSLSRDGFISLFLICVTFLSFSCLTLLARTSYMILNQEVARGDLVPSHRWEVSSFWHHVEY